MHFVSTRGNVGDAGFIQTFLMGLGNDGGLMVPHEVPLVNQDNLKEWEGLSFQELMLEIFGLFTNGEIPREDMKQLIDDSYASFRHPEVTPVRKLHDSLYVMELFHGPTFAFKDVALQLMGNLYAYVSRTRNEVIHILGATSGDTGASAISGVRGKEGIRICILHPHQRVSKVQELQMTTVQDENVLNLSVKGNFDDCQRIIKEMFSDLELKEKYHLRAINSINFVRILAQTVYYFYAYFRLQQEAPGKKISFSVPTGNFGDIFAGYLAKKMGLPIDKLIIATNENNILERFIREGVYKPGDFRSTYSPSMDIQIASNFERYLYYMCGEDAGAVRSWMAAFQAQGEIRISGDYLQKAQRDFAAYGVGGEECLSTISKYSAEYGYLLDPHTACGVAAYEAVGAAADGVCVALSTAHPAKFDEAIRLCDIEQEFPAEISSLFDKPQRQTVVEHSYEEVLKQVEHFLQ
ncbi:MAG: threonine synthase [Paenibacillaceae bacterium]|jgi:threonine synthase|nr:threonine synthase [Paenibacillaceae bacterium]